VLWKTKPNSQPTSTQLAQIDENYWYRMHWTTAVEHDHQVEIKSNCRCNWKSIL